MSVSLTKSQAALLLSQNFITQEAYDQMFSDGIVKASSRTSRPQINVPSENKDEFQDKAYEAMLAIATEMGFDFSNPTADSGLATLYLKGAGKARKTEEVSEETDLI